ncbi:hypothetical protein AB833_20120 [Chromatiales bacterium (ex Bugula neritina AB1)]|nr:hypothetical protein AB833_20120 [Chromatiales bacterium (ex Bugula neritina AB1)]
MDSVLPSRFKPADLAQRKYSGNLTLPVSHFKRFSALLADNTGEVRAAARFFVGENLQINSVGSLQVTVNVACQRCMKAMPLKINSDFSFAFVEDENSAVFQEETYDPLLLDEHREISAVDFLEDELILQLPLRQVHDDEQACDNTVIEAVTSAETIGPAKTHNPFSDLDKLLKK